MAKGTFINEPADKLVKLLSHIVEELGEMAYAHKYRQFNFTPEMPEHGDTLLRAIALQAKQKPEGAAYPTIDAVTVWELPGSLWLRLRMTPKNDSVELDCKVGGISWYKTYIRDANEFIYQTLKANCALRPACDCLDCTDPEGPCRYSCDCAKQECSHRLIGMGSLRDKEGVIAQLKPNLAASLTANQAASYEQEEYTSTEEQIASVCHARSTLDRMLANSLTYVPLTTWTSIGGGVEILKITDTEGCEVSLSFTLSELLDLDRQIRFMNRGALEEAQRRLVKKDARNAFDFDCISLPHIEYRDGKFEIKVDLRAIPRRNTNLLALYLGSMTAARAYQDGEQTYLDINTAIHRAKTNSNLSNRERRNEVQSLKQELIDLNLVPTPSPLRIDV